MCSIKCEGEEVLASEEGLCSMELITQFGSQRASLISKSCVSSVVRIGLPVGKWA
jgi:hypothetical protein